MSLHDTPFSIAADETKSSWLFVIYTWLDPTNPLICKFTIRIGGKCLVDRGNLSVTRLINLNSRRNIRVKIDTCFQDVWRPCLCYVLKFNHLGIQAMLVNRIYRWTICFTIYVQSILHQVCFDSNYLFHK